MKRHMRDNYYIVGEGTVYCDHDGKPAVDPYPGDIPEMRKFRFPRMGPKGTAIKRASLEALVQVMTASPGDDSAGHPHTGRLHLPGPVHRP